MIIEHSSPATGPEYKDRAPQHDCRSALFPPLLVDSHQTHRYLSGLASLTVTDMSLPLGAW